MTGILVCATAVTRGWNGYRNESAQKVDPGEENSPGSLAGARTRDLFDYESGALTSELSPLPKAVEKSS